MGTTTTGDPTFGYGQTVDTTVVSGSRDDIETANLVTAQQHRDLYIDIIRARAHQVGSNNVTIEPFPVGNFAVNDTNTDKVLESYILSLESLATSIENDRFLVDPLTQITIDSFLTSTRLNSQSGAWNGTISHVFTVTFSNVNARRHFFNAGGEIRFSASVDYSGSQAKTLDWQNTLADMGTISFKANQTISNAGVGTGSNIGNYQLTGSYQRLYTKSGGGVYAENEYEIYGLQNSTTQLQFRVDFADNDQGSGAGDPIDEDVLGDFNSVIELAIPDGTVDINGTIYDTVVITNLPSGNTTSNL